MPWRMPCTCTAHAQRTRAYTVLTGMRLHEMVAEVRAAGGDEFEEMVAGALGALIAEDMEAFGEFCAAARAIAGWMFGGSIGASHL